MADQIKSVKVKKNIKEASAMSKGVLIAPTKLNLILAKIRGKSYTKALGTFKDLPQKAGSAIWLTLHSAIANAINNYGFSKNELIISKAFANQGSMLKRVQPRAKGRAYEIQKKMSHITIYVSKIIV